MSCGRGFLCFERHMVAKCPTRLHLWHRLSLVQRHWLDLWSWSPQQPHLYRFICSGGLHTYEEVPPRLFDLRKLGFVWHKAKVESASAICAVCYSLASLACANVKRRSSVRSLPARSCVRSFFDMHLSTTWLRIKASDWAPNSLCCTSFLNRTTNCETVSSAFWNSRRKTCLWKVTFTCGWKCAFSTATALS